MQKELLILTAKITKKPRDDRVKEYCAGLLYQNSMACKTYFINLPANSVA